MDVIQKSWNIFQSILRSVGPGVLESAESQEALLLLFEKILAGLQYAVPIVKMIMNFISFALQAYQLIRRVINGGSQRLEY